MPISASYSLRDMRAKEADPWHKTRRIVSLPSLSGGGKRKEEGTTMNLTCRRAGKSGLGHYVGHKADGVASHRSRNTYGGEGSSIEKEEGRKLGEERISCLKTVFKMGLSEVGEGM